MNVTLEAKMIKIPKQEYTTKFKAQAVKRVAEVGSMGRVAEELGQPRAATWPGSEGAHRTANA